MAMSPATTLEPLVGPAVRTQPRGSTGTTPGEGEPFPIRAKDGHPLSGTLYAPDGAGIGGVVLINAATGARQRYYARFARFLAARGLPTVTYDYRGIGGSRPPRLEGFKARMEDWGAQDLAGAITAMRERFPAKRLLLVGHSVGGQLLGLAENANEVSAALTVASGSGYYRLFPQRRRMALNWRVLAPTLVKAFGKLPGWAGTAEDLPAGVALQWARWCLHPDYMLSEGGEARRTAYAALRLPLRAYSFTDDPIASPAAVKSLLSIFPGASVEHRLLSPKETGRPIGHFGFFREPFRASLWSHAAEWLAHHALLSRPPTTRG